MVLYRYTAAKWGIAILLNLCVRITPPNEFNDPFEFTPTAVNPLNHSDQLNDYLRQQGEDSSVESLQKVNPVLRKNNQIASGFGQFLTNTDMTSLSVASQKLGVVCLSKLKDDIRMWGHYGDKHKGVAIGLDFNREVDGINGVIALEPVRYKKYRARLNPMLEQQSNEWHQEMLNASLTKSREWRHEREYRMVCRLCDFKEELRKQRGKIMINRFVIIGPETVREVILGCLINGKDEAVIRRLCASKLPYARLTKMVCHPTEFDLVATVAKNFVVERQKRTDSSKR